MHLSSRTNRLHTAAPTFLILHPVLASAANEAAPKQSDGPWTLLQFAWESGETFGWQRIGTFLLLATVLSILLLWPFSRMIAGPTRILTETTLFVGSMLALTAAFLALAGFSMRAESVALLVVMGLVYLAILFAQTRHIFSASRGAAGGILGCFLVVSVGAFFASEQLTGPMPWTQFFLKSKDERSRLFSEWQSGKKAVAATTPAIANSPAPAAAASAPSTPVSAPATQPAATSPLAAATAPAPTEGGMDLHALYLQLQKARAELNMNDPVAVSQFNVQAEAYNQEKIIAAAQAARRQKAGAAPSVRPNLSSGQAVPVASTNGR